MSGEFYLLLFSTIALAFFHTLTGPDHYLPFIVISKARNWDMKKTIWFTALCGLGHVGSSVILGFTGVTLGVAVEKLELLEGMRGSFITWIFTAFGLLYMVWGIRKAYKNRPHTHVHFHKDGDAHIHEHTHHNEHSHIHSDENKIKLTPWILFTVFIFGPCEPLIPIVMYPAAKLDFQSLVYLTSVFSLITIGTMVSLVAAASYGLKYIPVKKSGRYAHAMAGGTIFLCGMGMLILGL